MLICLFDLVWLYLNVWLIYYWLLLFVRYWYFGQLLLWLDLLANLRLVILLIVLLVGYFNGLRWLLRYVRECRIGFYRWGSYVRIRWYRRYRFVYCIECLLQSYFFGFLSSLYGSLGWSGWWFFIYFRLLGLLLLWNSYSYG